MYLVRFEEISRRSEPQNDDMSHTHTIQHPLQIQRSTLSEQIEQDAMLASVLEKTLSSPSMETTAVKMMWSLMRL